MLSGEGAPLKIAVIGSGISGLSAAWLLGKRHKVTLFERDHRPGGHSNTVDVKLANDVVPVDTGFIVFNEPAYPNLTAFFRHLEVATAATDMSFAVSLGGGRTEYAGGTLSGLVAQPANLLRSRYWSMLLDIVRFYKTAPGLVGTAAAHDMTLGDLLEAGGFGHALRDDHILPMAGAIWSAPATAMLDYPALSFVRFFENHGLFNLARRPLWQTVVGGSRRYVSRILDDFSGDVRLGSQAVRIRRTAAGVSVMVAGAEAEAFDHAVIATHADQAIEMLSDADEFERRLLGAFRYTRNRAVLHSDPAFMPRRRRAWASWNYLTTESGSNAPHSSVTYWMNRLQPLNTDAGLFVTLDPPAQPKAALIHHQEIYEHPLFDAAAHRAQQQLWSLQGVRRTWFCGSYFGAGFHEDGLQSGLAVAEQLAGVRRPWQVAGESGRIFLGPPAGLRSEILEAAE
ncbi:MAG: FAD-dependent oxidoreductase [Alphaproteobacteria bacterium]|nr:FAD-dependent oxidoreductase [Alphaproteobacteria bacterium]